MWVRAMETYDRVAKVVGPKKEALAIAEAEYAEARSGPGPRARSGAVGPNNGTSFFSPMDLAMDSDLGMGISMYSSECLIEHYGFLWNGKLEGC